jgi:hypothetical protein
MEFEKVNVLDARLVNEVPRVSMERGASSVSKNEISVTGGTVNPSALQWNIPITSSGLAVDTRWYVEYELTMTVPIKAVTATIAVGTPALVVGQNICLDAYPLSSLMTQSSVLINEKQVCSYDISQYRQLLLRTVDNSKLNPDAICPSLVETGISNYSQSFLTRSNPMSTFADSDANFVPNGAWPLTFSAGNTAGIAYTNANFTNITVSVKGYEPLLISPCNWNLSKENDESCPFYVRNIQINLPLGSASRFFRFNESYAIGTSTIQVDYANIAVNTFTKAVLHYYTVAPPLLEGYSLPKQSIHHTYDLITNSISGVAYAGNKGNAETQQITLSNQNLSGMPRFIVLGAMKDKTQYTASQSSFFFPITQLVISNGNTQNILASYKMQDLFAMSRRNGMKVDYLSYSGVANVISFASDGTPYAASPVQTCSAPVIIDTRDLELPYNVTNGSSGNFVMTFQATVLNSEINPVGGGNAYLSSTPVLKALFIYDEYIVTDSVTLQTDIKKSFLSPSAPLENAPIKASNDEVNEVVGGALHKMKSSHGGSSNISKSQAVAKLSKRLAY